MTKSKYVFFVLGIVYLGIALGSFFSVISINNNVLLGLSVSSCLISAGELVNSVGSFFSCRNSFCYSLKYTSEYLSFRIANNIQPRTNVDVYNIKFGIDEALANRKAIHPVEYDKKKVFPVLRLISRVLFIIGIACFILVPFINHEFNTQTASRVITIVAFAFMCLDIGVNDLVQETVSEKIRFEYDKVVIIDDAFTGFTNDYYYHLQHYTAYSETQKKVEEEKICPSYERVDTNITPTENDRTSKSLFDRLQKPD